jgi:hypothetical protein
VVVSYARLSNDNDNICLTSIILSPFSICLLPKYSRSYNIQTIQDANNNFIYIMIPVF